MLYHLSVAVAGVVVLTTLWIAVQSLSRRLSRSSRDTDVLDCWTCDDDGSGCHGCVPRAASQSEESNDGRE